MKTMISIVFGLIRPIWMIHCLLGCCFLYHVGCYTDLEEKGVPEPTPGTYSVEVDPRIIDIILDPNDIDPPVITKVVTVKATCIPKGQDVPPGCNNFQPGWNLSYMQIKRSIISGTPAGDGPETEVVIHIDKREILNQASRDRSTVQHIVNGDIYVLPRNMPPGFKKDDQRRARVSIYVKIPETDSESKATLSNLELSSSVGAISFSPNRNSAHIPYYNNGKTTAIVEEPYITGINADRFSVSGAETGKFAPGLYRGLTVIQDNVPQDSEVYSAELVIPYDNGESLRIPITSQK